MRHESQNLIARIPNAESVFGTFLNWRSCPRTHLESFFYAIDNMPYLELRNVSKGYGSNGARTDVLANINLSVEKGEFVAIVGYSGAGKTTLMSLIAGLIKADGGTIKLNDLEITEP